MILNQSLDVNVFKFPCKHWLSIQSYYFYFTDDEEMEIEEENTIEVKKDLSLLAIKSVKSLDCPLCSERFQHPRLLPCLHTFCSSCIQKRVSLKAEKTQKYCPFKF